MIRFLSVIMILFLPYLGISQQLSGLVTDDNNEPLSYVNIHIKNTSKGTTTNIEGRYSLKIDEGQHDVVFQYVGYKTIEKKVNVRKDLKELNIQMEVESYEAATIEISADAEDPAYAIIRQAQAKRKYYLQKMKDFSCDAYVRGFSKVLDAPEKILGQDVGDMEGTLDSTRQGVFYLSESVSKYYVKGNKSKEVLYSSKVSGDDQGYSFNSASEMEFNFYEKNLDLNRKIISPIAPSAMSYYKFQLDGTHYEADGQLVNRIKVIPKNDYSPSFYGYIYINEDLWNIHSLELGVTAKASQIPVIDSLTFRQIFIPLEEERWMPLSNVIRFKMGALGFKVAGNFACVFSNYVMDETNDEIFNREVYKVEKEANTRTEEYWDSLRPIPLTIEEKIDYKRKDSIRIVKESPEYLDSIDKVRNKLKVSSFLTGHTFQNSKKKTRFSYKSPLNVEVNTIQGWVFNPSLTYTKGYDDNWYKRLRIKTGLNYGLSEKELRTQVEILYQANRINNLSFSISGGRELTQYNKIKPISTFLNSLFTQAFGRNYLKAYDRKFVEIRAQRYLGDLFFGRVGIEYADRSAVVNNYLSSFRKEEDRQFTSNDPQFPDNNSSAFVDHRALIFRAGLRIRLGAEVWSYPDRKFRSGSDWPSIWIYYKRAIPINRLSPDFDLLYTTISKSFSIGTLGDAFVYGSAGKFLRKKNVPFIDQYYFLGNQTNVRDPFVYRNSFLLLPYYTHSTDDAFLDVHLEHNFKGFVFSKVPGIRALGWHLVGGAKYLNSSTQSTYSEFYFGINNIGYNVFRPFRIDFVWANHNCDAEGNCNKLTTFGIVLGVEADF